MTVIDKASFDTAGMPVYETGGKSAQIGRQAPSLSAENTKFKPPFPERQRRYRVGIHPLAPLPRS